MNQSKWIVILILGVSTIGLSIYLAVFQSNQSLNLEPPVHDEWEVQRVGGMAFDDQNSNVYLTSSAKSTSDAANSEDTASTKCLIQMLSFTPEKGFASVNHGVFPRRDGLLYSSSFACPGDPRCLVRRRHLQDDFHQVDENSYPETCPDVYIQNNQAILLGRLPQQENETRSKLGSVMVMNLDANKIGGNDTQEFQLIEEPLAVATGDEKTMYLAAQSRSRNDSIFLYRYSKLNDSWQLDWEKSHVISEGALKVDIVSLDVILGGQFLVVAGSTIRGHGLHAGHFGIYHSDDGSMAKVHGNSYDLQEPQGQQHMIDCVCVDQQESDAIVAIMYQISTIVFQEVTVAVVNKMRIARATKRRKQRKNDELSQTPIWTKEIMHASMTKCQLPKNNEDALVLGGYVKDEHNKGVFAITKRSKSNGALLWLTQKLTWGDKTVSNVRLADITMDNQNNILVYGQVVQKGDSNGDVVLLQALKGTTGEVLAQTNSPAMVVTPMVSTSSLQSRSSPQIISREQLIENYDLPLSLLILGFAVSTIVAICIFANYQSSLREKEGKTFHNRVLDVFVYMAPFKADEVDIQQSPSGGFNVSYSDALLTRSDSSSSTLAGSSEAHRSETQRRDEVRRKLLSSQL